MSLFWISSHLGLSVVGEKWQTQDGDEEGQLPPVLYLVGYHGEYSYTQTTGSINGEPKHSSLRRSNRFITFQVWSLSKTKIRYGL